MRTAVNYLKRFKKDFPELSWADIIQLASAVSIEIAGGPKIPMRQASALPASLPLVFTHALSPPRPPAVCSQCLCAARPDVSAADRPQVRARGHHRPRGVPA